MIAAFALCVFLAASSAHAEYAERGKFVLAPSGALDIGLYGYANPALLSYVEGLEQGVAWSDSSSGHRAGLGRSYCPRPRLERPTRRAARPRRPNRGPRSGHRASQRKNRAVGGRDRRTDGAPPTQAVFACAYWASSRSPPPNSTTCNFVSSTMGCLCCWFPPTM